MRRAKFLWPKLKKDVSSCANARKMRARTPRLGQKRDARFTTPRENRCVLQLTLDAVPIVKKFRLQKPTPTTFSPRCGNPATKMNNLLTIFIVVTAAAVLLQAGILFAMYFAMRKTSAKVESLAEEVKTKVLPTAELAHSMMSELRPKITTVVDNVSVSTTMLRTQMERVDATITDIVDRTRLQVIRADEFVNSTMDKLQEPREVMQKTVVSPVRQISGLMRGVGAGLEAFFSRRRTRSSVSAPQDEMFI